MPIICWIVVGVGGAVVISCGPYLFIQWLRKFEKKQIVAAVKAILLVYAICNFAMAAFSLSAYLLLHDLLLGPDHLADKDRNHLANDLANLAWVHFVAGSVSSIASAVVFGYGRIAARPRHESDKLSSTWNTDKKIIVHALKMCFPYLVWVYGIVLLASGAISVYQRDLVTEKDRNDWARLAWSCFLIGSVSLIPPAAVFVYGRIAARRRNENPHPTP
jgi:hypothetical protein